MIYEYVRRHPGTHVRGMARQLQLATGDLQYHLLWLERRGLVKTRRSGFYRFVFPTMVFDEKQESLLGVLSQETPREILLCLLEGAMTQGALAKKLGHSQPTISWHMDRLEKAGVIARKKAKSRGWVYETVADKAEIARFVKSYHAGTWRRWSSRVGGLQRAGLMPPAVVELVGKR